jgi:hypothetical protein
MTTKRRLDSIEILIFVKTELFSNFQEPTEIHPIFGRVAVRIRRNVRDFVQEDVR